MTKGNLSINSENILPIIKKWLYSDRDIFVRELVSNAADAITKLNRLAGMGEADLPEDEVFEVRLVLDKEARTIKFIDNGIGMTADEIEKYINQIAFSGATDFINKYQEHDQDESKSEAEIIGHFGLGFYSAFMAAGRVEIDTLSYQAGAKPAKWACDGGIEYEISEGTRTARGTEITLFISDDAVDFLEDYKLRGVIKKYCGYLPVDIYFDNAALKSDDTKEQTPINDKNPLWTKRPADCTDEEYKKFFHQLFVDFNEPLFWIHLNADYPFRMKGILYFPKLKHELESIEGQVKLFSNQVYVAENIREVIPEFLLLLKGVIDCPDLPLNVSRSFLQNDENVAKMSGYIIRKVADKLTSLADDSREDYNKYWDDINQFIKYGCIREDDFYDKCKDAVLYKTTGGDYLTLEEYLARNEEKAGKKVIYADSENQQSQYAKLFAGQGIDCALLTTKLDVPFIQLVERKEEEISFVRIDAELSEAVKDEDDGADFSALIELFKASLGDAAPEIEAAALKDADIPAIILVSEDSRRMQEMMKLYGGMMPMGDMPGGEKLVLNKNNLAAQKLLAAVDSGLTEQNKLAAAFMYDVARLAHSQMDAVALEGFVARSCSLLDGFIGKGD